MRDIVRKEVAHLEREVVALRESHARLEREVAATRMLIGGTPAQDETPTQCEVPSTPELRPEAAAEAGAGDVLILWHNESCSKSRAALALLEQSGQPFQVRAYLDDPPTFDELAALRKQLGQEPIEWARTMDPAWCEHFDNATIYDDLLPDEDDIMRAMVQQPIMIERPILVRSGRAVVGRPPERVLELLNEHGSPGAGTDRDN